MSYFGDRFIKEYNEQIKRLKKGEEILNSWDDEKGVFVLLPKLSMQKCLNTYNEVVSKLSELQQQYKKQYNIEMTIEEKENGFIC